MELSLRLDTLGLLEMRYLRGRERYRDWPPFLMLAASRQARVLAYMSREVAEELHQQILFMETAVGLELEDEGDKEDTDEDTGSEVESVKPAERESGTFSPAFAQALERLNDLARQRLPEGSGGSATGDLPASDSETTGSDEEDALEQLQDAFVQMMEVVRELAEEMATDALKVTGRFRCARTSIEFIQADSDEEEDEEEETEQATSLPGEDNALEVEVELVMVLQLFEEGRSKPDDVPAVELRLDAEDFMRLHETLDLALDHDDRARRSRRRR